jgi:hypothetical protein
MKYSKMSFRYGLRIAFALVAYFLLMRLLGLLEVHWLRLFNGGIMAYGLYRLIKQCKEISGDGFSTFEAFAAGIRAGVLATFIFVIFMFFYTFLLDPGFSARILDIIGWEITKPIRILLITIFIEGAASSLVLSLTFIQLFKTSNNIIRNN